VMRRTFWKGKEVDKSHSEAYVVDIWPPQEFFSLFFVCVFVCEEGLFDSSLHFVTCLGQ